VSYSKPDNHYYRGVISMSTTNPVHATIDILSLVSTLNSVGAHIGAKLGAFHSDERTLTDELCDMFAIWSAAPATSSSSSLGTIDMTIQKLTAYQEKRIGGDFEIIIDTPRGSKRALFQAKVIDPSTLALRNNTPASRRHLRRQLRKAEIEVGKDLTFLLLYIPWVMLNGYQWTYQTWERGFVGNATGTLNSLMGTSIVPLSDLSGTGNRWNYSPSLRHVGNFTSPLNHISFTRVILELAACTRGIPSPNISINHLREIPSIGPQVLIKMEASKNNNWEQIEESIKMVLEIPEEWQLKL
jgi:hypothetical protein